MCNKIPEVGHGTHISRLNHQFGNHMGTTFSSALSVVVPTYTNIQLISTDIYWVSVCTKEEKEGINVY